MEPSVATAQTCLDSFLEGEQAERKCPTCQSVKGWKNMEIVVPPSTLILHLKRFTFEGVCYVCPHLLCLSPHIMSVPTNYVCPHQLITYYGWGQSINSYIEPFKLTRRVGRVGSAGMVLAKNNTTLWLHLAS